MTRDPIPANRFARWLAVPGNADRLLLNVTRGIVMTLFIVGFLWMVFTPGGADFSQWLRE